MLVEFHIGDAVHEQTAGTVGTLENRHPVAGFVELGGGGEARRTGTDDSDLLAGADAGRFWEHPAFLPAPVDNATLNILDRDRRGGDAEHAGALARRGTYAAGELRKVVGLVQAFERLTPETAVD